MSTACLRPATLVVVDANHDDYADLLAVANAANVNVRLLSSGRDALRLDRHCRARLWLISTRLPDTSGFELAQTLAHKRFDLRVFMVGDDYDVQEELRTLAAGLTMYVCKPLSIEWISQWGLKRLAAVSSDESVIVSPFRTGRESEGAAAIANHLGSDAQKDISSAAEERTAHDLAVSRCGRRRPAA